MEFTGRAKQRTLGVSRPFWHASRPKKPAVQVHRLTYFRESSLCGPQTIHVSGHRGIQLLGVSTIVRCKPRFIVRTKCRVAQGASVHQRIMVKRFTLAAELLLLCELIESSVFLKRGRYDAHFKRRFGYVIARLG